jgi:hypothetical protein
VSRRHGPARPSGPDRPRNTDSIAQAGRQGRRRKIFCFTEIRICRIGAASRLVGRGDRTSSRSWSRVAVDAAASGTRGAGRADCSVSPRLRADGRRCRLVSPAFCRPCAHAGKPCGEARVRVRQNRVVLAVMATVKPLADAASPTGWPASSMRGAREASRNLAPGRARHKPSTHCAGKAGCFRRHLYAAVRFFCVCLFAQRTAGASRHPVFPAPSRSKRDDATKARAKCAARS